MRSTGPVDLDEVYDQEHEILQSKPSLSDPPATSSSTLLSSECQEDDENEMGNDQEEEEEEEEEEDVPSMSTYFHSSDASLLAAAKLSAMAISTIPETGPIDVDDFILPMCPVFPSLQSSKSNISSHVCYDAWSDSIILDEVEYCRELTGYCEGFEPEVEEVDRGEHYWDEDVESEFHIVVEHQMSCASHSPPPSTAAEI
jgi:hypothetical protein